MTLNLSTVKKVAVQCGAHIERNSCNSEMLTSFTEHELLTFAKAIYAMGAAEQKEKDAKICDSKIDAEYKTGKVDHNEMAWCMSCAEAIRSQE